MNLPVIIQPEAADDLEAAKDWYERQRVGLGQLFAKRAAAVIQRIADNPKLYGEIEVGIRAVRIDRHSYVVYYRILDDRVDVLAVVHSRRDETAWRRRL